ncbi:hypothetical protein TRIUR3_08446 [Triticum urartu]|uniref:Uncharacterized protein n=1 Tax=Triticum urartu TaxID=4572 RepID=M7ZV56_TRIUA|nr:hypothetical protein TRIUR3_08446 [Triticum urartu]
MACVGTAWSILVKRGSTRGQIRYDTKCLHSQITSAWPCSSLVPTAGSFSGGAAPPQRRRGVGGRPHGGGDPRHGRAGRLRSRCAGRASVGAAASISSVFTFGRRLMTSRAWARPEGLQQAARRTLAVGRSLALEVLQVLVRWRRGREARSVPVAWARVHQRRRRRCEFLVGEVAIWVIDEPSGAWYGKHPLHGRVHRWRRQQFHGIRGDVGGRGLILVLDSDPCSNLFIDSVWCGSSLLGHDQDVFSGRIRPGTRSWRSKGVAAVHPTVTTVKALAMGVAAKEATTRTVATKRSTVWCIAAAEAAIPVQAALTAVAKVPATSSSRTKSPLRGAREHAYKGFSVGVNHDLVSCPATRGWSLETPRLLMHQLSPYALLYISCPSQLHASTGAMSSRLMHLVRSHAEAALQGQPPFTRRSSQASPSSTLTTSSTPTTVGDIGPAPMDAAIVVEFFSAGPSDFSDMA